MSKFHIMIHIEVEADDIFIDQKKGENISNNLDCSYNAYVQSVMEEKEDSE